MLVAEKKLPRRERLAEQFEAAFIAAPQAGQSDWPQLAQSASPNPTLAPQAGQGRATWVPQ
jgi:hypothetical protein